EPARQDRDFGSGGAQPDWRDVAGVLLEQAESLLAHGAELQKQQLQAREGARAEERVQGALRIAGRLVDETIAGLRGLASTGPGGRPDIKAASSAQALGKIDWASLLDRP